MTEPTTYHAVLYQGPDGVQFYGPRCKTRACAVKTINPLDGTTVLGLVELDHDPGTALAFWKRHQAEHSAPVAPAALIAGALFDFLGFLTTRDTPVTLGASELASPAVELLGQWAKTRGLSLGSARVSDWQAEAAEEVADA